MTKLFATKRQDQRDDNHAGQDQVPNREARPQSRRSDRHDSRFFRLRRHTRLTSRRPNRPLGRNISTATISTSAIVSLSSRPK